EAYVPVIVDDRIVAVIKVYIDQTAKRASFAKSIAGGLAALMVVIVLAAGLPAAAFYRRTRQMQSADDEAEFLAGHDRLTGLVNRPHLHALTEIWLEAGQGVALCSIDLDRFGLVVDSVGQANGDDLLRQIADRLHSVLGPGPTIARLGGDEFAVVQPGIGSDADAESIGRQITAAFAAPFAVPGGQVSVRASVGAAVSTAGRRDAAGLLSDAATALHRARAAGGGQSRLYRSEMDSEQRDRHALEILIGKALAEDRFAVHFQPVYRAADRRLLAFEALMRMSREDGSPVSPSRFIPIAEDMGLIGDIGEFVLRKACAAAAEWPPEISVAINLSPVQFENGGLVATVEAALRDAGLAPGRLELEITEGVLLRNTEPVLSQLRALKALGVSIAMDDFGIGYSSLSYLWRFPFDRLKIDASFVRALQQDKAGVASILQAIISLGRALRMEVTAEGVETEEQALFLAGLGCNSLQGFHLGRPVPASDIPVMILNDSSGWLQGCACRSARRRKNRHRAAKPAEPSPDSVGRSQRADLSGPTSEVREQKKGCQHHGGPEGHAAGRP
ncbi:MAG TPA: EAL domain-containing protein, partial [Arenibaculum sp.]|nr:EAL domain-containing protein [Arenibaculum sp.]